MHSVTLDSPALSDPALHRALADFRNRGVRIGLSTSGPAQSEVIRRALDITIDGSRLFTVVQSTWNLLEQSAAPALAEAAAGGAEVTVKEVVANGRLTPGSTDAGSRATELAESCGLPLDQVALAAALAQPWATRVLSGATDLAQLNSNIAAASVVVSRDRALRTGCLAVERSDGSGAGAGRPRPVAGRSRPG